jgi:ActR/RegA family two-component response regulator
MPRFRQQEVVATRRIALTGHGTVETAREGLEKGAREYLLKPCDFNTLLGSI